MSTPAPPAAATDALLDFLRFGSELTLHSFANHDRTTVLSRRIFLFLRDTTTIQYGKAGTLHWTYIPSTITAAAYANTPQARLELDSQRLALHTLTDLRSAKQTDVFRHPVLKGLIESVCFSLSSNVGVEMNLSAVSVEEKDKWWKGIMAKLQSGRKQLLITNSSSAAASSSSANSTSSAASPASALSPSGSPMSPGSSNPALILRSGTPSPVPPSPSSSGSSLSPTSLRRLLTNGAFFKKYDMDPVTGHVTATSIYLWAEGVGKAGDLYWVEAKPLAGFVPPPSTVLPASHSLPLGKITDFMLRKKSVALKASPAPDACCFALVSSDKSTLNLECESKEVCKTWREGLINMLLTAGKQVVRADTPATPSASSSSASFASASASPLSQPAVVPQVPLMRSPSEERDLFLLTTGAIFTLYYTNSKHQPEQAKITLFFVDLLPPSDPGALCWCNVGSKRMIEGQRLMLNTMKQMISGCEHSSFRHSVPGDVRLDPDCCFTIVGKSLILNLEAASSSVREGWMKGLHGVMLRYQQGANEKKRLAQEMAAKAAKEILASNEPSFAQAASPAANHQQQHQPSYSALPSPPSPQSTNVSISSRSPSPSFATPSHSPSPSLSSPSLDDQIGRLKKGDLFTLYTASSSSPNDVQSHAIFLFYVDELSPPGYLYYCAPPPLPRQLSDNQRFALASLSRMVAGKETAIFQNDRMRSVGVDRCLSIIGKHSMLNVEAVSVEVRDLWIKTLHAIMTRYKATKQQQQLQPGQPMSVQPVTTPTAVLSPSGGSSPVAGSSPPSPSSTNALSSNPLYNPATPLSPHAVPQPSPVSHSQSTPTPITTPPPAASASVSSSAGPFVTFAQEPEAVYLASSHSFKLYAASPVGFPSITEIQLFFQALPAPHPDAPGALFWCPAGKQREMKESCKLPLTRILQMAGGKETAIFRHMAAAAVPKERCLYLTSATVSLSLEAASVELKNVWMQQLHALMMKMGRQTIEERKGKDQRSVSSPQLPTPPPAPDKDTTHAAMNGASSSGVVAAIVPPVSPQPQSVSPSSAVSASPAGSPASSTSPTSATKSTVDIKTAQQTVQAGQVFTLYHFSPTGEPLAERLLFFFVPFASGPEQPGVLYWCAPDRPQERDEKRRFVLNTIKQMRAGKDTPILKSSIASKARSSHCLSLSSSSLTLNLEAPSAEIAELWRKSLHTVLVRNGMKAVEDQPTPSTAAAISAAASSSAVSAGSAAGVGASRPLNSSVASHINRTINFMDPTEFFSLRAKIGEGSYGAVYKAIDHRDGQAVAIKIIPFSGKDSLKLRKEIRTLRQCHSPFIVGYKGAFHKQDNVWIIMEYVYTHRYTHIHPYRRARLMTDRPASFCSALCFRYCAAGSLSDMMAICKHTLSEQQIANVMKQCFSQTDTRVLTDTGFLFLTDIEARITAGQRVLYACYDTATKGIVYRPGRLVESAAPTHWVDFTHAGTRHHWDDTSDDYGSTVPAGGVWANRLTLRTTPEHDMYVQLCTRDGEDGHESYEPRLAGDAPIAPHKQTARELAPGYQCECDAAGRTCTHGYSHYRMYTGAASGLHTPADVVSLSDRDPHSPVAALGLQSTDELAAFLELFGYWLGNGTMTYHTRADLASKDAVCFEARNNHDCVCLRGLLDRLHLVCGQHFSSCESDLQLEVRITEPRWFRFFDDEFGVAYSNSRHYDRRLAVPKQGMHSRQRRPSTSTASTVSASAAVSSTRARSLSESASVELVADYSGDDDAEDMSPCEADLVEEEDDRAASDKWLPDWVLFRLGAEQLRLVIEGLRRAAGRSAATAARQHSAAVGDKAMQNEQQICTSSVGFRDQLIHACMHAGYSAYFTLNTATGEVCGHNAVPDHDGFCSEEEMEAALQVDSTRQFKSVCGKQDSWWVCYSEVISELLPAQDVRFDGGTCRVRQKKEQRSGQAIQQQQAAVIATQPADLYDQKRDGRVWCVSVDHPDAVIFAQRAHRNARGVVTKVGRSMVVGNCLAGLAYLHGQGKIHRDIKGGNILSDSHGMCKLADFGVSGNLDKTLGKHRTVIGTPHWMAPEVLMSDDYNELADIWSLGITAYELAVGEPPHAKLHSMRAALKIPMSAPPTLPDPAHWSEHFHAFLRSCLIKDFHARPSAIDLLSHPFIANAPNASVLMDMVRQSVKIIEAKASELSKEQGLSMSGSGAAGESKEGARRTSGEVAEDELDGDLEEEEEAPRIRSNPRSS